MQSKLTDFSSSLNIREIQSLIKDIKGLGGDKHGSKAQMHSFLATNVIIDSKVSTHSDDRGIWLSTPDHLKHATEKKRFEE